MKDLTKILALFLLVFFSFSCVSDDDKEDDKKLTSQTEKATGESKWINTNTSSKIASLEFSKSGNYIIVENVLTKSTFEQQIYFGTYTIADASSISLSDYGTLKVISVADNTVSIQITPKGSSTPITFNGAKMDNMKATTKTDLLCQTWEVVKYNGEVAAGTEFEDATILFSKAGTYFTVLPKGEDSEGGLALWKWKPETNETQFLYTWNSSFEGDYDGGFVTINTLTETDLKITEVFEGEKPEDSIHIWELKPVNNTKSSVVTSITNNTFGKGLFGNK